MDDCKRLWIKQRDLCPIIYNYFNKFYEWYCGYNIGGRDKTFVTSFTHTYDFCIFLLHQAPRTDINIDRTLNFPIEGFKHNPNRCPFCRPPIWQMTEVLKTNKTRHLKQKQLFLFWQIVVQSGIIKHISFTFRNINAFVLWIFGWRIYHQKIYQQSNIIFRRFNYLENFFHRVPPEKTFSCSVTSDWICKW